MYNGYKIVCVIPAGRRRYMHALMPYIVTSGHVDEIHIWMNTNNENDLEYLRSLSALYDKIRLIAAPPMQSSKNTDNVGRFYTKAIDPDTIYIKLDDDIVFMESNFFETFLAFRFEHRDAFMCFPMTINNAMCTYVHDCFGLAEVVDGVHIVPWAGDGLTYGDPRFAEKVHRYFLRQYDAGDLLPLRHDAFSFNFTMSINCCAWFGSDFARFGGVVPSWMLDEYYLTVDMPLKLKKLNAFCGQTIVSHFAFFVQRNYLDQTDLLDRYYAICKQEVPDFNWGEYDALINTCKFDMWDTGIVAAGKAFANGLKKMSGKKCYVWGTGSFYKAIRHIFEGYEIAAFVTNDANSVGGTLDGVPIISPFELNARPVYPLFICSQCYNAIVEQLKFNAPKFDIIYTHDQYTFR